MKRMQADQNVSAQMILILISASICWEPRLKVKFTHLFFITLIAVIFITLISNKHRPALNCYV